ncbi:MAG: hypothetical protein K2O32_15250 [Acetatifactor sp.]|nr:hypothetical protein [Acetatifactor sp.]
MILTGIILMLFNVAEFAFRLLPDVNLEVPINVMNTFFDILAGVMYFFPMRQISPIFGIIVVLQTWRVGVVIVRTIWSLMPGGG